MSPGLMSVISATSEEVHLPFPERHRKIFVPVRMVFGNFQSERKELHHAVLIDLHESSVFRREDQRRWVTEIYKTEICHSGRISP